MAEKTIINQNFNGNFEIVIIHNIKDGHELIYPIVEDGVKWETERQGSPGKLTFKVYNDPSGNLTFTEGDGVTLRFQDNVGGWITLFNGYVFTKKRTKDGWIDVTAYDQLRYLKNKATYVFKDKTAAQIVRMIANDYKLPIGSIRDTNYVIGERVEDNQTLFDIIQNALDETLRATSKMYVLYTDDRGICLRDANDMKLDLIINNSVAEGFDYKSSIDDETYNEVELFYDNNETNKREYYHAVDSTNVGKWGRLRLTESIQTPTNAKDRVTKMLEVYNRKTKELKVTGAFGDYRCRAGTLVGVQLELGDVVVNNYMFVEKATHTFKKDEYRMDLTLDGFGEEETTPNVTYTELNVVEPPKPTSEPKPPTHTKVSIISNAKTDWYEASVFYYPEKPDEQARITLTNTKRYVTFDTLLTRPVTLRLERSNNPFYFGRTYSILSKSAGWELTHEGTSESDPDVWTLKYPDSNGDWFEFKWNE